MASLPATKVLSLNPDIWAYVHDPHWLFADWGAFVTSPTFSGSSSACTTARWNPRWQDCACGCVRIYWGRREAKRLA